MSSEMIDSGPRPAMRCAALSMAVGSRRLLAAIVMGLCAAGPTIAGNIDPAALDIEGRWVAVGLTLDLSRCKEGWCGVEVTDAKCGRTALRLTAADRRNVRTTSPNLLGGSNAQRRRSPTSSRPTSCRACQP